MAVYGRCTLRNLFDDSPTPHIAHPPRTHHRHFYVATDGSYRESGGGLGVVIETHDGERVARLSVPDSPPDNNVAEYRALHLGLDVLAARAPPTARVGVLVDHANLAANVNTATILSQDRDWLPHHQFTIPAHAEHHWRGIRARICGFEELRAAQICSGDNPAHSLANAPHQYGHVNNEPARCVLPQPFDVPQSPSDTGVPPPSRADRHAGD